jgi:hypothetical protein
MPVSPAGDRSRLAATPVIATAVGGTTDLLGDPPAGVLQARVASRFSGAVWRARLLELYRPFLDGHGPERPRADRQSG